MIWKDNLTLKHLKLAPLASRCLYNYQFFLAILSLWFSGLHCLDELFIPVNKDYFAKRNLISHSLLLSSNYHHFFLHIIFLTIHKTLNIPCMALNFLNSSSCPICLLKSFLQLWDPLHLTETRSFICFNGSLPSVSWFLNLFPSNFLSHSLHPGGENVLT